MILAANNIHADGKARADLCPFRSNKLYAGFLMMALLCYEKQNCIPDTGYNIK